MRLNKYLSECGVASRRKAEEFIKEGRISVNREIVVDLAFQIDPSKDDVRFDGEKVKGEEKVYFILNKPKAVITSTKDEQKRKTVVDLIPTNRTVFPVGRLDFNTTGVLILTNDGDFSNYVTHPSNKFPREYVATLHKSLDKKDREQLGKNIVLDGRNSKFVEIDHPNKHNGFKIVRVVTVEGRNQFVKRMFKSLGYTVTQLDRTNFAGITCERIPQGKFQQVELQELKSLLSKKI